MTPQPKRKHSKGRRDRRRGQDFIEAVNLVTCSNCGEVRPAHTVCPNCGFYHSREVISVEKESKAK